MTEQELARYGVGRGEEEDFCCVCLKPIALDSECLMVPKDCDETAKMDAGKPYVCFKAHRACLERIP